MDLDLGEEAMETVLSYLQVCCMLCA